MAVLFAPVTDQPAPPGRVNSAQRGQSAPADSNTLFALEQLDSFASQPHGDRNHVTLYNNGTTGRWSNRRTWGLFSFFQLERKRM